MGGMGRRMQVKNKYIIEVLAALEKNGYSKSMINYKMFHGKSIADKINLGQYEKGHLNELLKECVIMKKSYEESGLAKSRAKPTSDWQCYISIPGGGE